VAIFPTDTVFGLGSNPRLKDAVVRCYQIKERPREKQVPVLFSEMQKAEEFVEFDYTSRKLAQTFWPGKLSIVLPVKKRDLPKELTGESKTLAVRIPDHDCCRRLIASSGGSLIGTSANSSGHPPFTNAEDRDLIEFAKKVDFFIRGPCSEGSPSTVVEISQSGQVQILRKGAISEEAILASMRKN
jgi:L-threonylcarbamoyladenylate synthase